ncbi:MAG: hypothetical protein AB4352_27160 [Hormoscilla sp.]
MRVILILITLGNFSYIAMHMLTQKAKVVSNPQQLSPTRDNDLDRFSELELKIASEIAPPETLNIPQLSGNSYALNSKGTRPSPQASDENIGQLPLTSPIAVPSNLGSDLPEFSLGFPESSPIAAEIPTVREKYPRSIDNSFPRPSPPSTIAIAPTQTQPVLASYPVVPTANPLPKGRAKDLLPLENAAQKQAFVQKNKTVVAQGIGQDSSPVSPADVEEIRRLQQQLEGLEATTVAENEARSPGMTIAIPSAFGADNNTLYTAASFQERVRGSESNDGSLGLGIGLGDATESVGVELSYTFASFGNNTRDFGSGAFNLKVHRRLSEDFAIAAGVNGLVNLGDDNGFENSFYGVATKIFRTKEDIDRPFSRIVVTAGLGNGHFRTAEALSDDEDGINVFGNVAFRVAQPVSIIAEWSGQDLGVGLSIVPFENIPLVITPAVRDLAGGGNKPRFVLGGGFLYRF